MAKAKLSKEAIKYIIETYECEKITYTFPEIKSLVAEKFGINVSAESIRQSYHKNKDSFKETLVKGNTLNKVGINKPTKETENKQVSFNRKFEKPKPTGFDDSTPDNEEIQDLLKPKGDI